MSIERTTCYGKAKGNKPSKHSSLFTENVTMVPQIFYVYIKKSLGRIYYTKYLWQRIQQIFIPNVLAEKTKHCGKDKWLQSTVRRSSIKILTVEADRSNSKSVNVLIDNKPEGAVSLNWK